MLTLDQCLQRLVDGGSFTAFAQESSIHWNRLASSILRKCGYTSVERNDLVQAMLFAVWTNIPKWDPNRGSLGSFITFVAIVAVQRIAMEGKGLHGRRRNEAINAPGVYVVVSDVEELKSAKVTSNVEQLVQVREHVFNRLNELSVRDRSLVMTALRNGSICRTASELAVDTASCKELGLQPNLVTIRNTVRRAARKLLEAEV